MVYLTGKVNQISIILSISSGQPFPTPKISFVGHLCVFQLLLGQLGPILSKTFFRRDLRKRHEDRHGANLKAAGLTASLIAPPLSGFSSLGLGNSAIIIPDSDSESHDSEGEDYFTEVAENCNTSPGQGVTSAAQDNSSIINQALSCNPGPPWDEFLYLESPRPQIISKQFESVPTL